MFQRLRKLIPGLHVWYWPWMLQADSGRARYRSPDVLCHEGTGDRPGPRPAGGGPETGRNGPRQSSKDLGSSWHKNSIQHIGLAYGFPHGLTV